MADDDEVLRRRHRELRTRYGQGWLDAKMKADPSILYEPTPDELAAKAAATRNPNWQAPAVKGPTLWERIKTFDPEAALRGGAQVVSRGAIDEVIGGNASNPTLNPMVPPTYPAAVKLAAKSPAEKQKINREATKEYRDADDEKRTNSPTSYFLGGAAGMGLAGNPASAFSAGLPRVGALGAEGLLGGLMSSRGDLGTKEGRMEALLDAGTGTAFGLGAGGVTEAVGRTLRPRNLPGVPEPQPSLAERAYQNQVTTDVTKAANPTYAKRAVGDPGAREMVVDLIEREPTINKLRTGPREELAQAADNVATRLDPERLPIYDRFDQGPGRITYKELDDYLASEAVKSKLNLGQNSELERGLEHVRERLATRLATQKKLAPAGLEPTLSHAEAREWVTGLLKQKKQTVGSVNETAAYNWRNELHQTADDFLKERMDLGAQVYPHLKPDLERLRPLNKDIAAALKIEDVASNAEDLSNWKRKPLHERVRAGVEKATTRAAMGGVAGGGVTRGITGAAVGAGAAAVIPPIAGNLTRVGVEALGKLSRAARRGDNLAQYIVDASTAGVPEKAIQAAILAESAEKRKPPPKNPNEAVRQRREVKP